MVASTRAYTYSCIRNSSSLTFIPNFAARPPRRNTSVPSQAPNEGRSASQKPPSQELQSILPIDTAPCDGSLQTPVTSEQLTSLRRIIEQKIHALDDQSRHCFRKLANAGERAMTARDLLFKENHDLFKQNNESNTRTSSNSTMVGKGKVMSYEDILEVQKKRDEKEAAQDIRDW